MTRHTTLALAAVAIFVSSAALAFAADQPVEKVRLIPGDRLRLKSTELGSESVVGEVLEVGDHSLLLRPRGQTDSVRIEWSSVSKVQLSAGRRSYGWLGAAVGLVGGLVMVSNHPPCRNEWCPQYGFPGVAATTLAGAVVGQLITTERWAGFPPAQIGVVALPRSGGMGAGLAVRF
jgi:hypothetical protein